MFFLLQMNPNNTNTNKKKTKTQSNTDKCTLILTEGDSAKALAVSGLSVVGRDHFGVFALKGKPVNVRDAKFSVIQKNEEIKNLISILGLDISKQYQGKKKSRINEIYSNKQQTNKQTNKQTTNKQPNNQTNNQTNKQPNKQTNKFP
jgi:DNA gyrase/topoisomerase IV subunit B